MSALARWFHLRGQLVLGYDKTPTPLTQKLIDEGINVFYDENIERIPSASVQSNTLVVFTPAVPESHGQLQYFKDQGYNVLKRSAVLGLISRKYYTIAVAGTHGKTTTSSMLTHLLVASGIDTLAFLGGIATNYNSNLVPNKSEEAVLVVEADEYDRSFLTLEPDVAIVTAVEPDHLDIYGSEFNLQKAFDQFLAQCTGNGEVLLSKNANKKIEKSNACIYGINEGKIRAENIKIVNHRFLFDYVNGSNTIRNINLKQPGQHNTENALAAIRTALKLGAKEEKIRDGLTSYQGVKRRFEYIIDSEDMVFIDDYAHHPTEITAFLSTLKALYPGKEATVIFQPHLFTRTRDLLDGFASSLNLADHLLLLDIYPAREEPLKGITSQIIADKLKSKKVNLLTKEQILPWIDAQRPSLLATVGAGDIDQLVPIIKDKLQTLANI